MTESDSNWGGDQRRAERFAREQAAREAWRNEEWVAGRAAREQEAEDDDQRRADAFAREQEAEDDFWDQVRAEERKARRMFARADKGGEAWWRNATPRQRRFAVEGAEAAAVWAARNEFEQNEFDRTH